MNPVQTMFSELRRLEGVVRADEDVIPRFTIFTPNKMYRVQVQFVPNQQEMAKRLNVVADFMRREDASAFVLAYELGDPHAIAALIVSDIVDCLVRRISRGPTITFGTVE